MNKEKKPSPQNREKYLTQAQIVQKESENLNHPVQIHNTKPSTQVSSSLISDSPCIRICVIHIFNLRERPFQGCMNQVYVYNEQIPHSSFILTLSQQTGQQSTRICQCCSWTGRLSYWRCWCHWSRCTRGYRNVNYLFLDELLQPANQTSVDSSMVVRS